MRWTSCSRIFAIVVLPFAATNIASAALFVRPGLSYFDYQATGVDGGFGPSLALGTALGANREHEIGLDVARAPWSWRYDSSGLLSSLNQNVDGHLVPVLASYRFNFGAPANRLRFFVGASGGTTKWSGRDRSTISTNVGGTVFEGGPDQWTATWGGTAGVVLGLADNMAIELGYRYLDVGGVDYRVNLVGGATTGSHHVDDLKTHVVTAAFAFRF